MRDLQVLSLSNMDRVKPHIWEYIGSMTRLEELSLACGLGDENLMENLPTLTVLKILNLNGNNHSAESLYAIAALSNLEYLDLSSIGSVSAELFEHFTPLVNLRSLLLSVTEQLAPENMAVIGRCLPQLEYFSLYDGVNDRWCQALGSAAVSNLKHLFLEDADAITDTGARSLGSLVHLQSLSLSGMELTERGLSSALINMEQLTFLDLHSCHMLDDEAIVASLKHLTSMIDLRLSNNSGLTDMALDVLSYLHRVESLSVAKCPNFTNGAIRAVARWAPQLRYLDISMCAGINNDAVFWMEQMHNLQVLLADGSKITHSGLGKLRARLEEYSASPDPTRRCVVS